MKDDLSKSLFQALTELDEDRQTASLIVQDVPNPPNGLDQQSIRVRPGEEAKLNCTTSSDITFCAFTAPDGTNFFLKKNIPYEGGRITYTGEDESTDCAVRIASVEEKDNGEWKCSITTIKDGQGVTVENAVSVIVSRPPSDVHIEVDGIAASTLTLDFRQSKSKKVTTSRETERLNLKPISFISFVPNIL